MSEEKYRLVTRSDFDGLVCAVLLNELNLIDEITFVHPKDMQDGKVAITSRDITTNLPYVPGAHLVFDHHESETVRNAGRRDTNHIIEAHAPLLISRASVVAQAGLGQGGQLLRQCHRCVQRLAVVHHAVGQAHGQGFVSAHGAARQDQIERPRQADQPG